MTRLKIMLIHQIIKNFSKLLIQTESYYYQVLKLYLD
jgi:hypothetical protein